MLPFIHIGPIQLPSYFLVISLAACLGILFFVFEIRKTKLSEPIALDLSLAILIGAFLGSRLFHIFYEQPAYYQEEPLAVLWIWQGGFVFYGGVMGALLLGSLLLKIRNQKIYPWLDPLALVFPAVYAIGRFATLLSGSGYGKPTNLPWGIVYPEGTEAPANISLHPTPIYSMLWMSALCIIVMQLSRHRTRYPHLKADGQLFWIVCMGYALGRLIVEQFRDDPRGENFLLLSVSSWLSLLILVTSFLFFLKGSKRCENKTS